MVAPAGGRPGRRRAGRRHGLRQGVDRQGPRCRSRSRTTPPRRPSPPAVKDLGDAKVAGDRGRRRARRRHARRATLSVAWTLPGDVPWSYAVPAAVVADRRTLGGGDPGPGGPPWHPDLAAGETLELERTSGERGDLLDRDGEPADAARHGARRAARPGQRHAGVGGGRSSGSSAPTKGSLDLGAGQGHGIRLEGPDPGDHLPRRGLGAAQGPPRGPRRRHRARRPSSRWPAPAPSRSRCSASFGEVTAEMVTESGGRYAAGDRAGRSGLQAQYDERLAGATGIRVTASGEPARRCSRRPPPTATTSTRPSTPRAGGRREGPRRRGAHGARGPRRRRRAER